MNHLTRRQLESMELAAQGLSSKQIGHHLRVGETAIKSYRYEAMQRLGAKSTAHAVALLMSRGLIGRCSVVASEAETIVVSGRAA